MVTWSSTSSVTWPGVDDVGSVALIVDVDVGRVDEAVVDVALVDAPSLVLTCPLVLDLDLALVLAPTAVVI